MKLLKVTLIVFSLLFLGCIAYAATEKHGDGNATVTTAGTRVQLSTTSKAYSQLTVCANTTNTGVITIGGPTVVASAGTRRGVPLYESDCMSFESTEYGYYGDLSEHYIDSTVDGEGVTYEYKYRT